MIKLEGEKNLLLDKKKFLESDKLKFNDEKNNLKNEQ